MESLGFSSFRSLLDLWDNVGPNLKIKAMLEDNGLVLFFKKDGKIYGSPESSRLVFARMKDPEDEAWAKEANFMAYDLGEAAKGNKVQVLYGMKDLDSIEIIDQEIAEKLLSKKGSKEPADLDAKEKNPTSPDNIPNMNKIGEQ